MKRLHLVELLLLVATLTLALPAFAAGPRSDTDPKPTPTVIQMTIAAPSPTPGPIVADPHQWDPGPFHVPTIAELSPALLSAIVGALLSLLFRFWPTARDWFDEQTADQKQSFMFGLTVCVAVVIGGINMARTGISEESLVMLGLIIYATLTANQTAYQFIKPHPQATAPF